MMGLPAIFIALSILSSAEERLRVVEVDTSAVQGQAFSARVKVKPLMSFDQVALELFETGAPCHKTGENPDSDSDWTCLAAVPADAKEGMYNVRILLNGEKAFASTAVIVPYGFPTYALNLSAEKKALYKAKGREKEVEKIRGTLATETPERLWEDFVFPVVGKMEGEYGERRTVDGRLKTGYHRGVDWAAPEGNPVLAAADGVVLLEGRYAEEGRMIILDHGQGVTTAYLHLSKILVDEGDEVEAGDVIGKVGSTGVSTSPHLHFGVYIHGTPLDPVYWFKEYPNLLRK